MSIVTKGMIVISGLFALVYIFGPAEYSATGIVSAIIGIGAVLVDNRYQRKNHLSHTEHSDPTHQ
ncbi:hypothetical protein BJI67_16500 (plasmid) [Acidihalobacter aeolianus]|uniref:Uncharacterized protein n=1 Tax=Acidihalobacter aeolianus TaxID=2792603 RepID=A0A1D8KCZ6_9GAMM|nr:hypothetical protein [Acidihalobacter aeolianus]AOV18838.1 hypothetical protein BJI67_16500 [Acidihalobacter aeolianus]